MEHWKSIKDYEGLYEVSNMGRIKSLQRTDKRGKTVNERILKPCTDKCGYLLLNLFKDGKGTKMLIHRMVAEKTGKPKDLAKRLLNIILTES